jgi:hypothetical protein
MTIFVQETPTPPSPEQAQERVRRFGRWLQEFHTCDQKQPPCLLGPKTTRQSSRIDVPYASET